MRRKAARALGQCLQRGDAYAAEILAEAVASHEDHKVRRIAENALGQITSQPCIDAVIAVWEATRHPVLTTLLLTHDWVASTPTKIRVLSALKTGHLDPLKEGDVEIVAVLVQACEDADEIIARHARQVLVQLRREEAKEALCRLVIEHHHPIALEAALETGYLPRDPSQRALFLFLTEQVSSSGTWETGSLVQ